MVTLHSEWTAIAARIDGFLSATGVYFQALVQSKSDPYATVDRLLLPESQRIYEELRGLNARHEQTLPPEAQMALKRFLSENTSYFKKDWAGGAPGIMRVAPALGAIRSEIAFHLADFTATARRLSERAFIHLQRSIVADDGIRSRWKIAFAQGELACERLGSVHLLSHGIWAFKVNAEGERTDLIFADRAIYQPEVESAAEAFVLTEWKKVAKAGEREAKAEQARDQARRYSSGSLAGVELASYRYIVLVSEHHLDPLQDLCVDGIVYRHVNIAADPLVPSQA